MHIIVESERYNPFITVRESIKKIDSCPSSVCCAVAARAKALAWTIVAVVELPFLIIAAVFKVILGTLTLLFAAVTRSSDRAKEGLGEFSWIGRNTLGLIGTIAVGTLSIVLPEFTMGDRMRLHAHDKYIFIPWCRKNQKEIRPDNPETSITFEGFLFSRSMDAEGNKTWTVVQIPDTVNRSTMRIAPVPLPTKNREKIEAYNKSQQPHFIYCQNSS